MTRQKRDFSALLPRRQRKKSTHASYLSVTNWYCCPNKFLFFIHNILKAEEITLTIGQAFDLAYKRFLSGKAAESESEKIARLERENCELRQRLGEVGALLTPAKLAEFLEKHNLKDLAAVGDSGGEGDHEVEEQSGKEGDDLARPSGGEADQQSPNVVPDSKLISFDSITATGLDTVTLDDLNDDDFDPRAFDQGNSGDSSDTSDDFNPRGSAALQAGPVIKPAEAVHQVKHRVFFDWSRP